MHRVCTIPTVALLLLLAPVAGAQIVLQPEPAPRAAPEEGATETEPEVVDELVEQLDDADWLMRDLATLELGELDPGITLETIEMYLRHEDLSHEQRARLRIAALRRFAARTKGALGVSFGTIRVGAIEVQPIPADVDFPASTMLKDGDQIAMVDQRIIDGSFSLRVEILSREPGEIMPTTVVRGERVLHLDLPLGSFANLAGGVRMDTELLTNALDRRWQRLGIIDAQADTTGANISIDDWRAAAFPDDAVPDPREPDMHTPRGWVIGPELNTELGNGGWSRVDLAVWDDPTLLRQSASQRAELLAADRMQPLIALRMLIERERDQTRDALGQDQEPQRRDQLESELRVLNERLDTILSEIERARPARGGP